MLGYLYINRNCTEANVGSQPFDDFHMYGRDSNADGLDYLLLHMRAKMISESLGKNSRNKSNPLALTNQCYYIMILISRILFVELLI